MHRPCTQEDHATQVIMHVCCEHAASPYTQSGHMQMLASDLGRQGCTSCGRAWQWQDLWVLASRSAMASGCKAGTCAAIAVQGACTGAHKVGLAYCSAAVYACPPLIPRTAEGLVTLLCTHLSKESTSTTYLPAVLCTDALSSLLAVLQGACAAGCRQLLLAPEAV